MNPDEYTKMFTLEDHYWWFVGRRDLALRLYCRASGSEGIVLDLGCGTGAVLKELPSSAIGLDMSPLALRYCAQRGLRRTLIADGTQLPLRDSVAQAIVGLDVFEHIEDDNAAFREAFRVLQPGGVLVLSVPAYPFLWGPHDVALHHFRRYRRPEMERKLRDAGFRIERSSYSVFLLFPVVVLTRMIEKQRRGPAHASLPRVPGALNRALIALQRFEAWLIERVPLPWGSSVVVVARKP